MGLKPSWIRVLNNDFLQKMDQRSPRTFDPKNGNN